MRFKKLMSAVIAGSMTASVMLSSAVFQTAAADETLTFDFRSNGKNTVSITAEEIAAGDVSVPFSVYITENPGVFGMNLKLQVNDGQVAEDGSFGNYGMTLNSAQFASPYCFDSENGGDPSASFSPTFSEKTMSIIWVCSQEDLDHNADAYAEAGTTAWSKSVSWADTYAFVQANLVVPKDTPAGEYKLDIRREKFVNLLTSGTETVKYGQSSCKAAGASGLLAYDSVPLTIIVNEPETTTSTTTTTTETTTSTTVTTTSTAPTETTSTTETTTSATVTTTSTTETTTSTTVTTTSTTESTTSTTVTTTSTAPIDTTPYWVDDYKIENGGHYFIIGDVCGKPGETVAVPIYVFGDPGTAGMTLYFETAGDAKITGFKRSSVNNAYTIIPTTNWEHNPQAYVFASAKEMIAPEGSILTTLQVTIPEDAADGTVYPIKFFTGEVEDQLLDEAETHLAVCNLDLQLLTPAYYNGSVTVVSDEKPALNYTSYAFPTVGDYVNLTLFHAKGEVTWTSADPEIATVTANGFVTAAKLGSTVITAACGGEEYQCTIMVGLFGDVDQNGVVGADDAQKALQCYVNLLAGKDNYFNETQKKIADVDGDGKLAAADAQFILQYYVNQLAGKTHITWYTITGNPKAPGGPEA